MQGRTLTDQQKKKTDHKIYILKKEAKKIASWLKVSQQDYIDQAAIWSFVSFLLSGSHHRRRSQCNWLLTPDCQQPVFQSMIRTVALMGSGGATIQEHLLEVTGRIQTISHQFNACSVISDGVDTIHLCEAFLVSFPLISFFFIPWFSLCEWNFCCYGARLLAKCLLASAFSSLTLYRTCTEILGHRTF